jgi:hypothetical protein
MQAGEGAPSHLSPAGTFYFDILAGITYQNINGINNWVVIFGGNNKLIDIYVTGGTYSSGTAVFTNNTGGTFNVSGFSTGGGGSSIFTGGTVNGATNFTNGVTANTFSATSINRVDYVIFNTGITNSSTVAGTVFFDNTEHALSYNTSINQGVTVNLGQQNYLRVFNNTGVDIQKGKTLEVLSSYSGLPSVTLALNKHIGFNVLGVSAEIIPNNTEGIAITNGVISNIELTGMSVGSLVYASDSVAGKLEDSTKYISFPLTARTNSVGYVIATGSTTGKLFVNIINENSVLSLTDLERNVLEGNAVSTGVFTYGGITLSTGNTFNIGPTQGWIVDNTSDVLNPDTMYINYSGQTGLTTPYMTAYTSTYILLNTATTITLLHDFPTPQQRRQNIYLGKLGHGTRTNLINAFNEPDFDISPLSQLRDMFTPIKIMNAGVITSPNGANMTFNSSAGIIYGFGVGSSDVLNPNSLNISGNTPVTFQYRTQTGGTGTNRTTIDPANYDLNGVLTAIGAPAKRATNQRIYLLQNGQFRIQYGQTIYTDLATAVSAAQTETFTTFPNFRDNGIIVGILSTRSDTTNLSDTAYAKFLYVSKFGELMGGTGGLSTTTLQQAYNNSTTPEILINSTLDGLTIQNGTGNSDATTHLIEGQNTAGSVTSFITAAGGFSGSSVSAVTITTASVTANATGLTSKSTYGTVNVTPNTNNGMIIFSGSGTVGGTGYTDFLKVTNTAAGATNTNKTFRVNITGDLEFVNSAYTAIALSLTDAGVLNTPGGGTSDRRLKNNIEYISIDVSPIIQQFKPVKFEFNDYKDIVRHGFIAQDVLEFKPELVLGDGDKENGVYGLDYDGILSLTVKALQESIKRIEYLEKQIQELKNK